MQKCDDCQIDYPDGLVSTMSGFSPSMGGSFLKFVCGICALALANKIHGQDRIRFDGTSAEIKRQQAIEFRKANNLA